MASLSVFLVEHFSVISNLISLRTSTFKPGFIESQDVNIIVLQKRDISTSLFLQLRIFTCVNFSLEELKEEINESNFLNGGGVYGL